VTGSISVLADQTPTSARASTRHVTQYRLPSGDLLSRQHQNDSHCRQPGPILGKRSTAPMEVILWPEALRGRQWIRVLCRTSETLRDFRLVVLAPDWMENGAIDVLGVSSV
jgi:hypothetical protein